MFGAQDATDWKEGEVPKAKESKKKYPKEVTAVAKATRQSLPEGARAPGAKQVAAVIAALGDRGAAEAAGISVAKLRKWARDGERPDDYKELRPFAHQVDDPWAVSRRLAVILVGVEDYRKASEKEAAAS